MNIALYDALDISEYICYYCEQIKNKPITNMHLQKYLYFLFKKFKHEYNSLLFDNSIVAWSHGPVIPDVYYWYCDNIANPLKGITPKKKIDENIKKFISSMVDELLEIELYDLVKKAKKEQCLLDNYIPEKNIKINFNEI